MHKIVFTLVLFSSVIVTAMDKQTAPKTHDETLAIVKKIAPLNYNSFRKNFDQNFSSPMSPDDQAILLLEVFTNFASKKGLVENEKQNLTKPTRKKIDFLVTKRNFDVNQQINPEATFLSSVASHSAAFGDLEILKTVLKLGANPLRSIHPKSPAVLSVINGALEQYPLIKENDEQRFYDIIPYAIPVYSLLAEYCDQAALKNELLAEQNRELIRAVTAADHDEYAEDLAFQFPDNMDQELGEFAVLESLKEEMSTKNLSEKIEFLTKHMNINLNFSVDRKGTTLLTKVLHDSIKTEKTDVLEVMIENGADPLYHISGSDCAYGIALELLQKNKTPYVIDPLRLLYKPIVKRLNDTELAKTNPEAYNKALLAVLASFYIRIEPAEAKDREKLATESTGIIS